MSETDRRDPSKPDRRTGILARVGGRREGDPPAPTSGFPCPTCHQSTNVVDNMYRPNRRGHRRRRVCAACGEKFWTLETIDVSEAQNSRH